MLKSTLKAFVPAGIVNLYQSVLRRYEDRRNSNRTCEEVFSEIYQKKMWGGNEKFCSGSGSVDDTIVSAYVRVVRDLLASLPTPPIIVDLGCGDFSIGSQFVDLSREYKAVDVVGSLIEHLRQTHSRPELSFQQLDIARDPIPSGDICLIRQVLQHLSNTQIENILRKLSAFEMAIITEHYPDDSLNTIPNLDKVHGSTIRLFRNSGVHLDYPPFAQYVKRIELMLEVPSHPLGSLAKPGVIRTYLVIPNSPHPTTLGTGT